MRMRRKSNLDARMARCSELLVPDPREMRGRWLSGGGNTGFGSAGCRDCNGSSSGDADIDSCGGNAVFDELRVELGCGKGRFTVESALAEPGVLFVALEKNADALVMALEHASLEGLANARFMKAFADDITDYFAPGEVSRIYINFCDPWPGNRHAKRRLTCARFLRMYRQVLRPGGELRFRTDNLPLFEFSLKEFECNGFADMDATRDLHGDGVSGIMTDYERKFHELGMPICECIARPVNQA